MTLPSDLLALFGHHSNILLLIGLTILLGTCGARIFQKLRIPQVVGFIVMGIVIGDSGFKLLSKEFVLSMSMLNFMALGIIGFNIGGELKLATFKKHGKQFIFLLLSEGLGAFFLVSISTTIISYYFTRNPATSLALGLLLGAISSATAPAATVDVVWEYRAKGLLTTTLMALVALDDGLALLLFSLASAAAKMLTAPNTTLSLFEILKEPAYEIFGSIFVGFILGAILNRLIRALRDPEKTLDFTFGSILLVCGIAIATELNVILAAMVLGTTIGNLAPQRSKEVFEIVKRFAPPIYALFFVFVGARLQIFGLPAMGWALAVAFLFGRSIGKISGIYFGATWLKSPAKIRKWLGLTLFSQAGVAIGLSILASQNFPGELGNLILLVVTTTTFIVQLIGPPCVKLALQKSKEIGLDVTTESLMEGLTVSEVMLDPPPAIHPHDRACTVLERFADSPTHAYPVIDTGSHLKGMIMIDDIRDAWNIGHNTLILADDMMVPPSEVIIASTPLSEALSLANELGLEVLPVVDSSETCNLVGLLDTRVMQQMLMREMRNKRIIAAQED